MSKLNINEIDFVYVVFYKSSGLGGGDWIMYGEGVFITEEGAKQATVRIYHDYRGGVQTKIEKKRILE